MAENKMKEVAKLLGVEMGEPFKVKDRTEKFIILEKGLCTEEDGTWSYALSKLLNGKWEIERPILDDVEKRYLEGVLRPFRDRIHYIIKIKSKDKEYISVNMDSVIIYCYTNFKFPYFNEGTMYKCMESNKEYTLEELGLFEYD